MEDLLRAGLMNALTASALAVVVAGLSLVLSRRPALVHCLWLIVLAKLAAPPLFEAPLGPIAAGLETVWRTAPAEPELEPVEFTLELIAAEPETTTTLPPLESFSAVAEEPEAHDPASIGWAIPWRALGVVWLAGAIAAGSVAVVRVIRFQRLLKGAEPAEDSVEAEIAGLAARMGLKRAPRAVLVEGRLAPLLWAVGRDPRLVLPRQLWRSLNERQRTLLLTHELAHWRRGDHRVRLLELAVTVAYWWLPVVWWVRRALRDVEEQCCDAWVVWMFPDEARTYAETLLDALDFLNPSADPEPLLASGFGKANHLRKRLVMVMKGTTPRSLSWTGALGALALAGVLLPASPIWAQKDDTIEFKGEPVATAAVGEKKAGASYQIVMYRGDDVDREKDMMEMARGLRARAEEMTEKKDATATEKENAKALLSAAEEFERLAKTTEEGTFPFEGGTIVIKRVAHGSGQIEFTYKSAEPELVQAARGRVAALRRELDDQQKRLLQTQRELTETTRKLIELQNEARRASGLLPRAKSQVRNLTPPSPAARDQERMEQLESKLSKILEELESLKKRKSEADAGKVIAPE